MGAIEIKTPSPQQARLLLRSAIELEKKLIRDNLMLTSERITELTRCAGVGPEQLLTGTVARHNALDPAAKHLLTYPHHKHLPHSLEHSPAPSLQAVLNKAARSIRHT